MAHAGGDNHSDHPLPLGGGGERFACGVISDHPPLTAGAVAGWPIACCNCCSEQ